ncbi:MAG: hypothetical protein ACM3JG_06225 [Thiohalocapsa sp.]
MPDLRRLSHQRCVASGVHLDRIRPGQTVIAMPHSRAETGSQSVHPRMPLGGAEAGRFLSLGFCGLLGVVTLLPLLCAAVPPLIDYPNHLARLWILVHRAEIPELARNYVVHWKLVPDLAIDFGVLALSAAMPVELAGRVFIALTMLGLIAGTMVLHRVLHGRFAVWPIWSVLFIYNAAMFWGFVSCLFAIGVYFFLFSGWIASRRWPIGPRLLVFAAASAVLWLLHLFAFGLYGLSVVSYEFGRALKDGRLPLKGLASVAVVCLQFIPGLVLWYLSRGKLPSIHTEYGDLGRKVYALFAPVTFGSTLAVLDRGLWLAAAVFLLLAARRGALKLVPEMRLPLAAMVAAALLMPYFANGSALADIRLPSVLPLVILAATQFSVRRQWLAGLLGVSALVLFGLRVWTVSASWQVYDRWFNEFRAASGVIAPGARLLIVEGAIPDDKRAIPGVPSAFATVQPNIFWHMGALAVIDRAAFFPYLFTDATPLDVTPRNRAMSSWGMPVTPEELVKSADPRSLQSPVAYDLYHHPLYWRDWPHNFDYVLWIDFGDRPKPQLKQLLPLASGSVFAVYRILKQ